MLQLVRASVSHAERSADAQQLHAFWGAAAALSDVNGPSAAHAPAGGSAVSLQRPPPAASRVGRVPGYAPTLLGGIGEDEACDDFSDTKQSTLVSDDNGEDCDGLTEVRPEDSISMAGVQGYGGPRMHQLAGHAHHHHHYAASSASLNFGNGGARHPRAPHHLQQQHPQALAATASFAGEPGGDGSLLIKLRDAGGSMHRLRCVPTDGWAALKTMAEARLDHANRGGIASQGIASQGMQPTVLDKLLYRDDDGDHVAIDSDDTLIEAAAQAVHLGNRLCVTAFVGGQPTFDDGDVPAHATPARAGSAHSSAALEAGASAAAATMAAAAGAAGPSSSAVSSFLGGLLAASSLAVGAGLVLAAKAAKR